MVFLIRYCSLKKVPHLNVASCSLQLTINDTYSHQIGIVFGFGDNSYGQALVFDDYKDFYSNQGEDQVRFTSIACTKTSSILVSRCGDVYTVGGKKGEKFGTLGREGGNRSIFKTFANL